MRSEPSNGSSPPQEPGERWVQPLLNGTRAPRSTQQGRPKPAVSWGSPASVRGPHAFRQWGLHGLTAACSGSREGCVKPRAAALRGHALLSVSPTLQPGCCGCRCLPWLCLPASLPPRPASCKHRVPSLSSLSTEVAFCNQF